MKNKQTEPSIPPVPHTPEIHPEPQLPTIIPSIPEIQPNVDPVPQTSPVEVPAKPFNNK